MRLQFKIIRKKFSKILISMIIIISLGVALLFGLMNGVLSLQKSVDKFIEENNYPDIKIITEVEDIDKINGLKQEDFKNIEYRLSISTVINKDDTILSVKASTYEDKDLDDFYIHKESENNSNHYDVLVEKKFADNNNIKLGDIVKLRIGDEFYNFYVSKIISIPEALVNAPIKGFWGELNDYGNVYINRKVLNEETNKTKTKLLDEVKNKEKELLTEENNKREEYEKAKSEIDNSLNEYYAQKEYYEAVKNELNEKRDELNSNKEKLEKLKNEYLETSDSINYYKNIIYSYINGYKSLSDDAKKYIDTAIESKYPNIQIEDLEFATDIAYSILEMNIDNVFDPNSEINQKIKNKIIMADSVRLILEEEYDYYHNNENADIDEATKAILEEIHRINNKLPFDSFMDLYNFLDTSRVLLPFIYEGYKDDLNPYYEKIVQINNSMKENIKAEVDSIYNCNSSCIQKAKLITDKVFDYIQNVVDKSVLSTLSEYTDDISGTPIEVIDRLLMAFGQIYEIDDNINNIDYQINTAYQLICSRRMDLENVFNTFNEEIAKAKQELNDKKIEIENIKGFESKFNEILINLHDTDNSEKVLSNVLDKYLKDIEVLDSYTYENSPLYNYISTDIGLMEKLSTIVPISFYIIILIILFLFISLMVKQGKKEIAILKALGKNNNEIRLGFCINNLLVAAIGIFLGVIIGIFPMVYMVQYFKNQFLLPSVVYTIDGLSIVLCIMVTIIVVELATIIATGELDKITPMEILKKEEYQNKEISRFTKFFTSKFKPFQKFSILVYLRNKRKLILGIICTSATVALIFSSLAYVASKNKIFNNYFEGRIYYDAQIFKNGIINDQEIDELRNLYYVEEADLLRYCNVTIKNNNKEKDIVINALDNSNNYISIFDKDNNEIEYPKSGIVLEEHIAKELGLSLNDEIDIEGVKFKIVDISFQELGRVNYISLDDSYKLKSSFDTIVLKMDKDNKDKLVNRVSSSDKYIYTAFMDEVKDYNKEIFDSYSLPAIIIIIFVLIIGYLIIININIYNLLDQKKNLSIFRNLGFQHGEISKNWFIQSLIQLSASMIIGLPCGILLSKFFLKSVSSSKREFIYASGIKEFIITALLTFIYMYLGHRKCMRKFKKINMVEEVKDRE